jgi:formate--tetrahydrofolate ligase
MEELAEIVLASLENESQYQPLYKVNDNVITKVEKIAKTIYRAKDVTFSKKALAKLELCKNLKYPICIAKTPSSFSGSAELKGAPTGFTLEISDININNGAQMIVCLTKGILLMPGLNEHANAFKIKIDDEGNLINTNEME